MSCLSFPQLPLQLAQRKRQSQKTADFSPSVTTQPPLAIVDRKSPQGIITFLDDAAQQAGLNAGMRVSQARALCPLLHTHEISTSEIDKETSEIARSLHLFSPNNEISQHIPFSFLLDPQGLEHLYPDLNTWAQSIRSYFRGRKLNASIFTGYETHQLISLAYASSNMGSSNTSRSNTGRSDTGSSSAKPSHKLRHRKSSRRTTSQAIKAKFKTYSAPEEEKADFLRIPLRHSPLPSSMFKHLDRLDIRTIADFLSFTYTDLVERFGKDIGNYHRFLSGTQNIPINSQSPEKDYESRGQLEPTAQVDRILFSTKSTFSPLVKRAKKEGRKIESIHLQLIPEDTRYLKKIDIKLIPSEPNTCERTWLDLIRLSLEKEITQNAKNLSTNFRHPKTYKGKKLDSDNDDFEIRANRALAFGYSEIILRANVLHLSGEQKQLHVEESKRDIHAGNKALARIRAAFGQNSVQCAELSDTHIWENKFRWKDFDKIKECSSKKPTTKRDANIQKAANVQKPSSNGTIPTRQPISLLKETLVPNRTTMSHRFFSAPMPYDLLNQPGQSPLWSSVRHGARSLSCQQNSHAGLPKKLSPSPFRIESDWWADRPFSRDYYYYAHRERILLTFFDRIRRKWFLAGYLD